MDERRESEAAPTKNRTRVERTSECEIVAERFPRGYAPFADLRPSRPHPPAGAGHLLGDAGRALRDFPVAHGELRGMDLVDGHFAERADAKRRRERHHVERRHRRHQADQKQHDQRCLEQSPLWDVQGRSNHVSNLAFSKRP